MSTLSVQEAMGLKVDREAVATLVLPQLWAMSMGPCKSRMSYPSLSLSNNLCSVKRGSISTIHGSHSKIGPTG